MQIYSNRARDPPRDNPSCLRRPTDDSWLFQRIDLEQKENQQELFAFIVSYAAIDLPPPTRRRLHGGKLEKLNLIAR